MSIEQTKGDLFESGCEALVNAVNCVGVMGGGIAAEFKRRYPDYFEDYKLGCECNDLVPGTCDVYLCEHEPRYLVSFPTKAHFKDPSKLSYVADGLKSLRQLILDLEIKSIAIPALGCGLGGLEWEAVAPLILSALGDLPDCRVVVYEPL